MISRTQISVVGMTVYHPTNEVARGSPEDPRRGCRASGPSPPRWQRSPRDNNRQLFEVKSLPNDTLPMNEKRGCYDRCVRIRDIL